MDQGGSDYATVVNSSSFALRYFLCSLVIHISAWIHITHYRYMSTYGDYNNICEFHTWSWLTHRLSSGVKFSRDAAVSFIMGRSNIDLDRYRWLKEKANIDFNDHVNVYGRTSLKMMSIRIDEEIKRANMMEKSECCKAGSMQEKRKAELAPLAA